MPPPLVAIGDIRFVLGFGFIGRVYRENRYTPASIGVSVAARRAQ
jgi:hypothetical protein